MSLPRHDSEPEIVSELIGHIYDAVLDPELWPEVLRRCCEFVPGGAANLFAQDAISKVALPFYVMWGLDPHFVQLYFERYMRINPVFPQTLFMNIGEVCSQHDLITPEVMRKTQFYKEWIEPQGWVDALASVLDKSATSCSVFTILRDQSHGLADQAARRRMELIVPHIRRAVLIGNVIERSRLESASIADALDAIAAAMFLVRADRGIVYANASGRTMLEVGELVAGVAGKLTAKDPEAERAITRLLSAAPGGDKAVGAQGTAIPLKARSGEQFVMHALSLTSGSRQRAGSATSAVAALFVRRAALDPAMPVEALARAYHLTPAEMRVLLAIVEVGGASEAAPVLGLSPETVKTHLHRIFNKTGTNGQPELVKLVAGYMNPLLEGPPL